MDEINLFCVLCKFYDLFDDGIEKACLILQVYFSFKSMVSGIYFPPDKDRDVLESNWIRKSNVLVAERLNNDKRKKQKQTAAVPLKLFGLCTLLGSLADDDEKVLRQHKGHSLSLVAKFLLLMIQEMAKINVKQLEKRKKRKTRSHGLIIHSNCKSEYTQTKQSMSTMANIMLLY